MRSPFDPVNAEVFTGDELRALVTAVRREIRHAERSRESMLERLGEQANTDRADEWLDWLRSAYVKLGHDPADIRRGSVARV